MKEFAFGVHEQISLEMIQYVRANGFIIHEAARQVGIKTRELELQVLLYLPRLIHSNHFPDLQTFAKEVRRLSLCIEFRINPYLEWRKPPVTPLLNPREMRFVDISEAEARVIHERFHYLSSFRSTSLHFGLRTSEEERLVGLVTLSPFDLKHISSQLPNGVEGSNVLVVSRVFCFDWAPRNAVSYMMSRIYKNIKLKTPEVKMLITYINPNLGFSGSSLKASNWIFFGREWGTRYTYIDGQYITDRQLIHRFGTSRPQALYHLLGSRFEVSQIKLDPLLLYIYFIDKRMISLPIEGFHHEFWRP